MARPIISFALPAADQAALEKFTRTGRRPVRAVRRAHALLALASGIGQQAAGQAVGLSRQAVGKVRHRYEAAGWQAALAEAPRSGGPPQVDGPQRAAGRRHGAGLHPGPGGPQPLDPAPAGQ